MTLAEEALSGGHTSVVVRVGDTVRRPAGRWTPAVHALLAHLEAVGFDGAPRVLGIDERDREVLAFVPGQVGTLSADEPLAPWFRGTEACFAIGAWLRSCHDAQAGFAPNPAMAWRRVPGRALEPGEVIVHHDVSPYNTVRRADGSLVVLDWDFARPGDPVEDLAWAAWRWCPLMAGTAWHAEYGCEGEPLPRQRANLAALLDGYRPSPRQRDRLADAVAREMTAHAAALEEMARTDPAFAALVEDGYARSARADAEWWSDPSVRAMLGG